MARQLGRELVKPTEGFSVVSTYYRVKRHPQSRLARLWWYGHTREWGFGDAEWLSRGLVWQVGLGSRNAPGSRSRQFVLSGEWSCPGSRRVFGWRSTWTREVRRHGGRAGSLWVVSRVQDRQLIERLRAILEL